MMRAMQQLRDSKPFIRLVLVWLMFALGVAVAAPLVNPDGLQLVCSGTSVKLVTSGGDGEESASGHGLDCPLCGCGGAPLPPTAAVLVAPATGALPQPPASRSCSTHCQPPLPARGPPALS